MKIVAGDIVTETNFFQGRNDQIDQLDLLLKETKDILILGPRRTGKTSIIHEYARRNSNKYKFLYINLESAENLYEFYMKIIKDLISSKGVVFSGAADMVAGSKAIYNKIANIINATDVEVEHFMTGYSAKLNIKNLPTFQEHTVKSLCDELSSLIDKIKDETILALDEFPELIWKLGSEEPEEEKKKQLRAEQAKVLLSSFRVIRQKLEKDRKVKIIIAGSVNLENTLSALGLIDSINDISKLEVPNLTPEKATSLAVELIKGEAIQIKDINEFKVFIQTNFGETSPFYIQLFLTELKKKFLTNQEPLSPVDLRTAYYNLLLNPQGPKKLRDRISRYYGKEGESLIKIIGFICEENPDQYKENEDIYDYIKDKIEGRDRYSILVQKAHSDCLLEVSGSKYGFNSTFIFNYWKYSLVGKINV